MPAKKKLHKLNFEYERDYMLVGIASHENDYRLSWALNKALNFKLAKTDDLITNHPKHKIDLNYSMYCFSDDEYLNYHLISNKSDKGFLLPTMKNIDFILKISGDADMDFLNKLLMKLKQIDIVITAFLIQDISERLEKIFNF